jgi:hypothetical protein
VKVDPEERAAALAAIRGAGVELTEPVDAWASDAPGRRQVFVSARATTVERGDIYDTWLVTLAADGSAISVERFRSTACR